MTGQEHIKYHSSFLLEINYDLYIILKTIYYRLYFMRILAISQKELQSFQVKDQVICHYYRD